MQLIRYNPLRDLLGVENDLDKLFSNKWPLMPFLLGDSIIDMYTEDDKLVAEIALPNFKREEIRVAASEDGLDVTAKHEEKEEKTGKRNYLQRESSYSYHRRVHLPVGADTDKITASFGNGKLIVTMPFTEGKEIKEVSIT